MTKRLTLAAALLLLLPLAAARAQGQPLRKIEHEFPNGSSVVLGLEGDRLTNFYYYGAGRAGRSPHECEVDLARGEGSSRWEDAGGATTIRSGEGRRAVSVTVRRARAGYFITFAGSRKGDFCGAGVSLPRRVTLTRRRAGRYSGRIWM